MLLPINYSPFFCKSSLKLTAKLLVYEVFLFELFIKLKLWAQSCAEEPAIGVLTKLGHHLQKWMLNDTWQFSSGSLYRLIVFVKQLSYHAPLSMFLVFVQRLIDLWSYNCCFIYMYVWNIIIIYYLINFELLSIMYCDFIWITVVDFYITHLKQ